MLFLVLPSTTKKGINCWGAYPGHDIYMDISWHFGVSLPVNALRRPSLCRSFMVSSEYHSFLSVFVVFAYPWHQVSGILFCLSLLYARIPVTWYHIPGTWYQTCCFVIILLFSLMLFLVLLSTEKRINCWGAYPGRDIYMHISWHCGVSLVVNALPRPSVCG